MKLSKLFIVGSVAATVALGGFSVSYADDDQAPNHDGCCNFNANKVIEHSEENHFNAQNGCCSLKKVNPSKRKEAKPEERPSDDPEIDPDIDPDFNI